MLATLVGTLVAASGACGDGTCQVEESPDTCAADCPPCGVIAAAGGEIDDTDACFVAGGPDEFIRVVPDAGYHGTLAWTHTTAAETASNFGQWSLFLAEDGSYRVEVYTDAAYAQSVQAAYQVRHATAVETVVVDQTAIDGWQTLGEWEFAIGGEQQIYLGDNTGEPGATDTQLVLDAVRLTRLDAPPDEVPPDDDPPDASGCATTGGSSPSSGFGGLACVALLWLRRHRASVRLGRGPLATRFGRQGRL